VVPGRALLSLELRDLDAAKIAAIARRIEARAQAIAAETGTTVTVKAVESDAPALADPALQRQIEASAGALGLSTMHLASGAGHDAAPMSTLGPMAMIFGPSVGGVSHSPRELTSWADCSNGANVLLQTLLRVDRS
jgi:N-carbamoyl-L-amino-acid hydrolase